MSVGTPIFTAKATLSCMNWYAYPNRAAELTAIATALTSDTTTHDKTIESTPPGLRPGHYANTPFTNEILHAVNLGKAGNFPVATMKTILTNLAAAPPNPIRGM